ncbi:MAG: hypothetical protein J7J99_05030 [Thermoprotei archaeon]|nr:hypothetical protein [Thermoprotei archaeon]
MSLSDIKSRILKLLKEDEEFRYAVAGLIGLSEILKEIREHDRKFNEILKVLKDHSARLEEHDRKFNRIEAKLLEHDKKFNKILKVLEEHSARLEEHDRKFNEILARLEEHDKKFNSIMNEIREIRRYMDRMAISLEEEAREVIRYKLRSMGLDVELRQLMLPDLEVNLYGVKDDIFIIGEVVTRAGLAVVERVDKILERLIKDYPSYTRRKVLKVIYTLWITPESVEEARRRNIWVVKALEELTKPKIIEVSTR